MPIKINDIKCKIGQKKDGVDLGGEYIIDCLSKKYLIHNIYFNKENNGYNGYIETYKSIYNYIDKYFCLNLGGDHSIGATTIQPLLDKYKDDILVIWIDAHADINTYNSSVTKNTHGMPVSCLFGLMKPWYTLDKQHHILKSENFVYIGIRDLDPPEIDYIKELNIKHSTKLTDDIINFIKNHPANKIHISFDIDGLDPIYAPSTGTISSNGLTCDDVKNIINISLDKLISLDVVEFNPYIGCDDDVTTTIINIVNIIKPVINKFNS